MKKNKTSDTFQTIYEVVKLIPKGRVSTYGAIAAYIGMKSGARVVGWAMNNAHSHSEIPAHRVVNAKGVLTGKFHFKDISMMEKLLQTEGIKVSNDQVVEFKTLLWDPSIELL